jgi:hypothetical protein
MIKSEDILILEDSDFYLKKTNYTNPQVIGEYIIEQINLIK